MPMIEMYSLYKYWDVSYGPFMPIFPYRSRIRTNRWGNRQHYPYRIRSDRDRYYSNPYCNRGMCCIYPEGMFMRHNVCHLLRHPTHPQHHRVHCLVVFILPLRLRHMIGHCSVYYGMPRPIYCLLHNYYPFTIARLLIDNLDSTQLCC